MTSCNAPTLHTAAERDVTCCYARSNKYWVKDPAGIAWETFHSLGAVPVYGESSEALQTQTACGAGACGTSTQGAAKTKAAGLLRLGKARCAVRRYRYARRKRPSSTLLLPCLRVPRCRRAT